MLAEIFTALVTPFDENGTIDYDCFATLCTHVVDEGSDGIVVAGTTGEAPTLAKDERLSLFRTAVDAVGGRATVLANTGTASTAESVELTKAADDLGVDGFLVVTPYYNIPPVRGTVAHFKAIADVTDKPIVIYNIPQRVVVNLDPDAIEKLAEIPNVVGVKQSTTSLDQAREIADQTDLLMYTGTDGLMLPFLELGAVGGVCVYTNVLPRQVRELVDSFKAGDVEEARRIDEEIRPVCEAVNGVATNPIAVKAALNMLGWNVGGLRLPLVEATDAEQAAIRAPLAELGMLQASA